MKSHEITIKSHEIPVNSCNFEKIPLNPMIFRMPWIGFVFSYGLSVPPRDMSRIPGDSEIAMSLAFSEKECDGRPATSRPVTVSLLIS